MAFSKGKYSQAISDRSGQAFPYSEMVREWNGSLVHISEYEPKHPQIRRKKVTADAVALQNARPQRPDPTSGFTLYIFNSTQSMLPSVGQNELGTELTSFSTTSAVGSVTVSTT